jgi:UDP-glucose 4-epimerase
VVRFFNTVGPRQVGRYGMVLPRFVKAALRNEPLEVHGDGTQSRCFCDVRDAVPALTQIVEGGKHAGRVFNLGHDEPITIRGLAELVKKTLKSESSIKLIPYEEAFAQGFDDLLVRQPNLTRIRDAIGWRPRTSLMQTILDIADELRVRPEADAPEVAPAKSAKAGAAR